MLLGPLGCFNMIPSSSLSCQWLVIFWCLVLWGQDEHVSLLPIQGLNVVLKFWEKYDLTVQCVHYPCVISRFDWSTYHQERRGTTWSVFASKTTWHTDSQQALLLFDLHPGLYVVYMWPEHLRQVLHGWIFGLGLIIRKWDKPLPAIAGRKICKLRILSWIEQRGWVQSVCLYGP